MKYLRISTGFFTTVHRSVNLLRNCQPVPVSALVHQSCNCSSVPPLPFKMLASKALSLPILFIISTWANCHVYTLDTQTAENPTLYSPILGVATRSCPESSAYTSCQTGPVKESHHAVNESSIIWPYQAFNWSPFNPPELEITTNAEPLAPGLLFITPSDGTSAVATKDTAPLIMRVIPS